MERTLIVSTFFIHQGDVGPTRNIPPTIKRTTTGKPNVALQGVESHNHMRNQRREEDRNINLIQEHLWVWTEHNEIRQISMYRIHLGNCLDRHITFDVTCIITHESELSPFIWHGISSLDNGIDSWTGFDDDPIHSSCCESFSSWSKHGESGKKKSRSSLLSSALENTSRKDVEFILTSGICYRKARDEFIFENKKVWIFGGENTDSPTRPCPILDQ